MQQQAQDVPVALPPIFCKLVLQPSARRQPPLIGQLLRVRRLRLRSLAGPVWRRPRFLAAPALRRPLRSPAGPVW